jgi:PAS domain S-box-containing protein
MPANSTAPLSTEDDARAALLDDNTERQRVARLLTIQRDLSLRLAEASNLIPALHVLLETVCRVEGIDSGGVYLVDPATGALNLAAHYGLGHEFTALAGRYDPDSPNAQMVNAGRPCYGRYADLRVDRNPALLNEELRGLAIIPICHDGRAIAALNLASHDHDEIPPHTRLALETIAAQIGGALARLSAQAALTESQENLQAFFDTIDDFVFVADAAGQILNTNAAVQTRLGYSAAELRRLTVWEMHPADRRDEVSATLTDMLAGRADICRIPLCSKDGARIPVETRVTHGRWSGQAVLIGISRDITERQRLEEALQAQMHFTERIVETTPDIIYIYDLVEQRPVYANRQAAAVLGYEPAAIQALGATFLPTHAHPDDWPRIQENFRRCVQAGDGEVLTVEYRLRDRQGRWRWFADRQTIFQRGADGAPRQIIGTAEDITERKAAEEQLQLSEARYHNLVETQADVISRSDLHGNLSFANDAYCRTFGVKCEDILNTNFQPTVVPEDWPAILATRETISRPPYRCYAEVRNVTPSGIRWFGWDNSSVLDEQGQIIEFQGVGRDITERKQAEETLRSRASELAALQATLLEINAPHDLPILLHTIVERAAGLLHAQGGGMYLCDPARREVRCVVSYNTPHDYTGTILAYGEGAAGTVAETGAPLMINDYRVWAKRAAVYDAEQPFTAVLSAPLLWQNQVTGVIHVLDNVAGRRFTDADLGLLTSFAGHAAIAVENARLYDAAQCELAERTRVEAARRESEAKYHTLFREMLDGFALHEIICDGQGHPADYRFLAVNPAFERMTGLKAQAIIGQTVLEVLPGTERYWIETYGKVALSGEPVVFENYAAELKKHFQVTAFRPAPNQFACIFADITERKRLERELQDERDFALQVFNTVGQGLTVTDAENRFVRVNPAYARLFGYAPQDLLGKHPAELTAPEDRAVLAQARLDRGQGKTTTYESRLIRKDGSYAHVLITGAPRLTDGEYAGTIAAITDITERKQAEETLRQTLADLQHSNTDLERFAYVASHDLQEPLRMVASFVQLLGERYRGQLDADADEFIAFAVDGAKRMQTLINDLLEYSRVGTRGEPFRPTDANAALDDALWNLDLAISDAGATVTHDPLPTVIADPTQLAQLFQNLIGNAIKFHGDRPPVVHVSARQMDDVQSTMYDVTPARDGAATARDDAARSRDDAARSRDDAATARDDAARSRDGAATARDDAATARDDAATARGRVTPSRDDVPAADDEASSPIAHRTSPIVHRPSDWRFAVRDNGIGIAPEDQGRIFGIFQRLHTRQEYPGTGIGLAVCQRIVERHGGKIWVESRLGQGTTFFFTLPAA